jgi:hypothetical protein
MKRLASFVVLLVILAFTAQTTVVHFFPEMKAFLAGNSGIAEEVVEEDETGEDDKVVVRSYPTMECVNATAGHFRHVVGTPSKFFREVLAPPPQA